MLNVLKGHFQKMLKSTKQSFCVCSANGVFLDIRTGMVLL